MQLSKAFISSYIVSIASAGYVVGDVWSTLSPLASPFTDATTDYTQTFGIAVEPVTSSVTLTSASSGVPITVDGTVLTQIQTASTTSSVVVATQIGDGQIQYVATSTTAPIISQITDGQVQNAVSTPAAVATTSSSSGSSAVATAISSFSSVVSTTSSVVTTSAVVSSSSDDITYVTYTPTTLVYVTLTDSDDEPTSTSPVNLDKRDTRALATSCLSDSSLALTLEGSVLTDAKGRIGSIVSNRQFQFDGPPPQAGAIYASGWSVTIDGKLSLGNQTVFYQCLSGTFYNLYDEFIAEQCEAVTFNVVDLVSC